MNKFWTFLKVVLPIALTVVLLQVATVQDSQAAPPAQTGYGQGGGGWHGGGGGGGGWYGEQYYRVRYGDTLFSIGRRFGVNPYRIAQVNGLYNPNVIYAGQVLYIPRGGNWNNCGWNNCNWNNNNNNNNWNNCGWNNCGHNPYSYGSGYYAPYQGGTYGYDYTGYYYQDQGGQRYSHTCGYNYNCY